MPLRLRRGTDTERQSITPLEGELIYVIDTKELWAGDGSTLGGIKVSGNIPESLNDLSDVDISSGVQLGQVLKWNGSAFVPANDIDTNTAGIIEGSNYRINILGDDSTILLDTSTNTHSGFFDGDLSGSVFGDDSTLIIDSVNNKIITNSISAKATSLNVDSKNFNISNPEIGESRLNILTNDDQSVLDLVREGNDLEVEAVRYGSIYFSKDDLNSRLTTSVIIGLYNELILGNDSTGSYSDASKFFVLNDGNFGFGKFSPDEKVDVDGNIAASGLITGASLKGTLVLDDSTIVIDGINGNITAPGFIQFGSFTTIERDLLSSTNGMVIYNSTTNRFQGYQNNIWINLDDGSAA